MHTLLTNQTASLTELRDPGAIIRKAKGKPVAIFNRNKLEGYFVPASAVENVDFYAASSKEVADVLKASLIDNKETVDYLRDK